MVTTSIGTGGIKIGWGLIKIESEAPGIEDRRISKDFGDLTENLMIGE